MSAVAAISIPGGASATPSSSEPLEPKIKKKWDDLRLPEDLAQNFPDFVRFMVKSGLIYTIVGFHNSTSRAASAAVFPLTSDRLQEPQIKVQGNMVAWSQFQRQISYNEDTKQFVSVDSSHQWTYVGQEGFIPQDRFAYEHIFPCDTLSQEQYEAVTANARRFLQTNVEVDRGVAKDCVLQFYTTPRPQLPDIPLFKNANSLFPIHIGVRLITNERKVYSLGFEMSPKTVEALCLTNLLQTDDVRIAMVDYEEFRSHEGTDRLVTSVPLSTARAAGILSQLQSYRAHQLRFNFMIQNCSVFARDMLRMAGYDIDLLMAPKEFFTALFPDLVQIFPALAPVIERVQQCSQWLRTWTPQAVQGSMALIYKGVTWIPHKLGCIVMNLALCALGATQMRTPLRDPTQDSKDNRLAISTFSCLISSWTEIFTKEPPMIYHSKPFIQWQLQQRSTQRHCYTGLPKMTIVLPDRV